MNELIEKILDNDQLGLLGVLINKPELLNELSESNRTPVDVAKATGNTYVYITLLRHQNNSDIEENWYSLLTEYISQISNDWLCSSWNEGIEFEIWHSLKGNILNISDFEECADLNLEMKKDLEWLSLKIDGWVTYEENEIVPLPQWKKQYCEWLHNKNA